MTSANRMRMSLVRESVFGTLPASPRMRTVRVTGEGLEYTPEFTDSAELRDDRMNADAIKVGESTLGPISFEWSYPVPHSALSECLAGLFWNDWVETPERDNDGTADSVITDVAATGGVFTVTTGAAFVAGHLIRTTGFGAAGNNGIFKITTGSATVPAVGNSLLTDEAAPAASARIKVVGFQGASGDITATSTGLGSSSLDFTTLGLAVGQWIKIGGSAAGDKFDNVAANNGWARVTAIAQNALTLDNLPSGWGTDNGSGKTIKVWFGDRIKNGTTRISHSVERSFLGQTTPTHFLHSGVWISGLQNFTIAAKRPITGQFQVGGLSSSQGTVANGNSYDAATTNPVMAGSVNVGRIAESGAAIAAPNWARELTITVANNNRALDAVDAVGAVDMNPGDFAVNGQLTTYFGSNALVTKLFAGTPGSINSLIQKNGQATIWQVPRATFRRGSANAGQKNSDVLLPLEWSASIDSLTSAHLLLDRVEYYES